MHPKVVAILDRHEARMKKINKMNAYILERLTAIQEELNSKKQEAPRRVLPTNLTHQIIIIDD